MNVICVPAYDRPEFLAVTLELLQKCKQADEFVYLFSLDSGFDMQCKEVIKQFPFEKVIVERKRTNLKLGKQSFNLLSAYGEACYLSDSKVLLIEDDFFCNPDALRWHLMAHEKEPNCFCSIATENHNTIFNTENSDEYYYHGATTDYQSWCVMWDKSVLETHILKHANGAYYADPVNYLWNIFKQEWIGKHFAEQDGLIRRVRYTLPEMPVIFPHKPRSFHAGFYSYHRNVMKKLKGNLNRKIGQIKEIIADPETYRKFCESPDFYNDSKAIDLNYNFTNDKLTLKQP